MRPGDGGQSLAGGIVDVVVPAQVAGVVPSDGLFHFLGELQLAALEQIIDELTADERRAAATDMSFTTVARRSWEARPCAERR